MVADTTKYVLLAANNSLQSVVHVHEKIIFQKLCSTYEKLQLMGYFRSPLIVVLNTVKIMLAVLIRRFYNVCKYMASLGTAKQSSWMNGIRALLCPSLTALVAAWIAFSHSSETLRLTFFLPRGIALQLTPAGNCLGQCLNDLRVFHLPPAQVGHAGVSTSRHSASAELLAMYCRF